MSTPRIVMGWKLRQMMATRGMFATSDLVGLLADRDIVLSRQYVHRLVTTPPKRLNIDLLAALCDILDCGPSDLLTPTVQTAEPAKTGTGDTGPGIGDLRPVRARVRRPNHDR